jgi:hypothetical protein
MRCVFIVFFMIFVFVGNIILRVVILTLSMSVVAVPMVIFVAVANQRMVALLSVLPDSQRRCFLLGKTTLICKFCFVLYRIVLYRIVLLSLVVGVDV